jgi:hypothetical protein
MGEIEAHRSRKADSMEESQMTTPQPETLEREKDKLFVTDAELIRRLGVPEKSARTAIRMFDRDLSKGFPQKQALWGDRRYWPAVRAWFDRHYIPTFLNRSPR